MHDVTTGTTSGLRRGVLGPAAIAFFVISAAGPLVAMAGGVPVAMLFGNGAGIPAMFLLATIVLCAFAAGYTAMARDVRNAGAFYAFAARGLGGRAAGATGMVALLSYNAIQIGLYGLFGAAAAGLIEPVTGRALPWYAYAAVAMASIAWFGYRRVDLSAKILGLLVAGEYLVVLILDLVIVASGGEAGLDARSFSPAVVATGSPAIGLMLCFAAFIGFEATTIYSEEARDPERTIPRATYVSVLLIGGFYCFSTWAVVSGAGVDRLLPMLRAGGDPTLFLFNLAHRYVGGPFELVMRVLFVTSCYASLLAFHNAIARYLFAMGREGLLPVRLGETHATYASPHIGSAVQSLFALCCVALFAVSGADPILTVFTLPSALATLGVITLMAITSLAVLAYFRHRRRGWFRTRATPAVSFVVLGGIALLATTRFDLLSGSNDRSTLALPLLLPLAGLLGLLLATRLRRRDPVRFSQLGRSADA
jgi:amino acid transporter